MQLGVTIPLQKFLKIKQPPYGEPCDLAFCWEIHKVPDIGRSTLIAVNASSRYALVFCPMRAASWKRIPQVVTEGIRQAMELDGYTPAQIETYLSAAGEPQLTKTHGRRPVAGLNRAVDFLSWMDKVIDERQLFQPWWSHSINKDICRSAGFADTGYGYPWKFFEEDLKRLGIVEP